MTAFFVKPKQLNISCYWIWYSISIYTIYESVWSIFLMNAAWWLYNSNVITHLFSVFFLYYFLYVTNHYCNSILLCEISKMEDCRKLSPIFFYLLSVSQNPPPLSFSHHAWMIFLTRLYNGRLLSAFDCPSLPETALFGHQQSRSSLKQSVDFLAKNFDLYRCHLRSLEFACKGSNMKLLLWAL